MPEEFKPGCQRPKIKKPESAETKEQNTEKKGELIAMVKPGQQAPDFTLPGYYQGKFANFSLSEYKGKWVLLCFYPGDFTFV